MVDDGGGVVWCDGGGAAVMTVAYTWHHTMSSSTDESWLLREGLGGISSAGVSDPLALDMPLAAAFSVEILKSRCASWTYLICTTGSRCILAIASEILMMASSCRTVIGMPLVFFETRCAFDYDLSVTYRFCSMWHASSESLGWTLPLA